jgi:hypothetical protein
VFSSRLRKRELLQHAYEGSSSSSICLVVFHRDLCRRSHWIFGLYLLARCCTGGWGPRAHEKVDQVKTDLQENKLRLASAVLFKTTSTTKYTDRHTTNSAGRLRERSGCSLARALVSLTASKCTRNFYFFPPFFFLWNFSYDGRDILFVLEYLTCRTWHSIHYSLLKSTSAILSVLTEPSRK